MKFYDTSSLLLAVDQLVSSGEKFYYSSITINELENIKSSLNKTAEIRTSAYKVLHGLDNGSLKGECQVYYPSYIKNYPCNVFSTLPDNNDMKILATAVYLQTSAFHDMIFVSNDIALREYAKIFFKNIESIKIKTNEEYTGYKKIKMTNDEMSHFYSNLNENIFNLKINEYIIVSDLAGNELEVRCWDGQMYRPLTFKSFDSALFGKIKPMAGDIYQQMAADSLQNNQITQIGGPAGSGKSILSMGYLFSLLEHGKIDKIIIFCNTVAAKNAAKLGYYPGERDLKLLDSQIGNMLASKIGSRIEVQRLIDEEKLALIPLSDIRGYDTSGMNAGVYITEAQNMDIELMRLALQRIGKDSICIIDGDSDAQVDLEAYEGKNNGMRRMSQVFRGNDIYGEVKLQRIHRSKIAELAQAM